MKQIAIRALGCCEVFNQDIEVKLGYPDFGTKTVYIIPNDNYLLRHIATDGEYSYIYEYNAQEEKERYLMVDINNPSIVEELPYEQYNSVYQQMFTDLGLDGIIIEDELIYIDVQRGYYISHINLNTAKKTSTNIHASKLELIAGEIHIWEEDVKTISEITGKKYPIDESLKTLKDFCENVGK